MSDSQKTLVICTTARSGSNLFCDYVTNTHAMGIPYEYFNPKVVESGYWHRRYPLEGSLPVGSYIEWLRESFQTPNGVFGVKLLFEDFEHYSHFPAFRDLVRTSTLVHLTRRNKLKQAISYYFAENTGQWVASDAPLRPADEVPFDFERIRAHLSRCINQDIRWREYFEADGLQHSEIVHEDFVRDPATVLKNIRDSLEVDTGESFPIVAKLKEQKIAKASEFRELFLERWRAEQLKDLDSVTYSTLQLTP